MQILSRADWANETVTNISTIMAAQAGGIIVKRRVVAIVLSLTMCMGGTLEAGAAALSTPDVQVVAETNSDSAADSFSDEEETVQQPQMEIQRMLLSRM